MNTNAVPDKTIAPIIKDLNELFSIFNNKLFDSALSKAVITVAPAMSFGNLGWCSRFKFWEDSSKNGYYEINISAEHLGDPFEEICETLIHEMCHLYNKLNDIQDCSRSSQYHNKKFKVCAEEHGLNVEKMGSNGYAYTTLKPLTLGFIRTLEFPGFDLYRKPRFQIEPQDEEEDETVRRTSSTRKYICPKCGLSLRATKEVRVICEDCNERLIRPKRD